MAEKKEIESQDNNDVSIEQEVIKRMGHISSELAHDLRGPLQIIQNAIYLIQKNPENQMLYGMVAQSISQATDLLERFSFNKSQIMGFVVISESFKKISSL